MVPGQRTMHHFYLHPKHRKYGALPMDLAGIEQTHKILKTLVQVTIFQNFTISKFAYF